MATSWEERTGAPESTFFDPSQTPDASPSFWTGVQSTLPQWAGGTWSGPQQDPTAAGSSPGLAQALQAASKSSVFNPKEPPALGAARPIDVPAGRPRQAASLDQLVQLLEKQRAQYGTLSGQPVQRAQVLGLLGF